MSSDQIAQLIYLGLLVTVIAGYFFMQNRLKLGKTLQMAGIWVLIFIGAIAGVGLWQDIRSTVLPQQAAFVDSGEVVVPRARDGHYYLNININGEPIDFVVDTGATDIVLTRADATRIGLRPEDLNFLGQAMTANGIVQTAMVRLDEMELGPFTDRAVRASVNGGEMSQSLLGMSYLQRFASIQIADNQLVLTR
ncbi:MAG: TIGR02281 family clan AA aspartic protease [Pseudomonadota bacterium]